MFLSTLHTNTAAGAVARLLDMEVEPFLLTSTIKAVLAQRLVRRLCPDCREPYTPAAETLRSAGLADGETAPAFYRATGCTERSAERRVGNACVRTCRSTWQPSH